MDDDGRGGPRTARLDLDGDVPVRDARRFVQQHLAGLVSERGMETVLLLTSELATNALMHGRAPWALRVSIRTNRVRVEVEDASAAPPQLRPAPQPGDGGLGVRLLDSQSSSWGYTPTRYGKIVWFDYEDEAPSAS